MIDQKKGLSTTIMLAVLLFSSSSFAYIVDRLYEAEYYVKSRSEAQRQAILSEGLTEVLTRVSGKPDVINNPIVQEALKSPNRYVQQYAYKGDKLEATFSPGHIQKLLNKAKYPIWSNNRPVLVVWLGMEANFDRRLIGQETDPSIVALIEKNADVRGLPVVVPLMDIEDMSHVSVLDVFGKFPSVLSQASSRYGYDGILVGRFSSQSGDDSSNWHADWQLLIDGRDFSWETNSVGLNQTIKVGIDGVVDKLAGLYAILPDLGPGSDILVKVEDVFSVSDYAKVLKYLKGLSTVRDVRVHHVEADHTIFKIIPQKGSTLEAITSTMDLDDNLVNLATSREQANFAAQYRWLPRDS